MHKLIIEDDEGKTTVVPMVRDELTIGRKEGNIIRLTERNVSRRHARLFKQNGAVCVEDFSSYTGVRVNGVRIVGTTPVREGDQVLIGDYRLSIRAEGAVEALPPTVPGVPAALSENPPPAGAAAVAAAPAGGAVPQAKTGVPAEGALDASPTIPLRTLEEQGRAPKLPQTQAGRLVVVTTDLAGMDFKLDRASLVIGRTDENDIILNHASISRHHAKVVRDGDRYTVVDLQSANGVRVAGESYERVDVQPGDVVELGHVKLRFVGPFEEWTFDPREYAPRSRRRLKLGAAIGGIVLAAVVIVALQGKKPPPPPPPAVTVAPAPVPAGPSPAALFADATKAAEAEDWDKSVSALDLLLSQAPSEALEAVKADAVELKTKVDIERRGAEIFASFQQAVASKEPDVALSRFDEIPSDSVYKKRAEPALEDVKPLFLAAHLDLADSARAQGRCDEARAEVEKIQQIDPENRKARDIVKKCRVRPPARVAAPSPPPSSPVVAPPAPVVAPPAPRPSAPRPSAPRAAAPRPVAPRAGRPAPGTQAGATRTVAAASPAAPSSGEPDEFQPDAVDLIKQAREAWMHQQCGLAIDLSRRALKTKPGSNDAHQIIAVCACSTKDKEGAIKSYSKLDERSRAMVRTLCARNGVELIE